MKTFGIVVVAGLAFAMPGTVRAQPAPPDQVDSMPKGIIGCALLAGELVLTIEAVAGVRNPWLLTLIPLAAAGGGAAGGYFLDDADEADVSVAMLALGATLLVPSILLALVLSAETYEDQSSRATVTQEPVGGGGGGARPPRTSALAPPALLNLSPEGPRLSMPTVLVAEAPRPSAWALSQPPGLEYHLSLFRWAF
ncbi:MAG: hypothetical protein QME96_15130 [Myxococcota bacterium]|nr:hypothetical protein [Myxococcota bacterium]